MPVSNLGAMPRRAVVVLCRHGESTANADGLFTGVLDVSLSERGRREAIEAGQLLRDSGLSFQHAYCSELARAWQTAEILEQELPTLPSFVRDWRLNERNYGGLTSLTKKAVREAFGEQQFLAWRRSVHTPPPPMRDDLYDALAATELFRRLPEAALVRTESLADVMIRVEAFWRERVDPALRRGENVLVVAHGNSLRALCAVVDDLPDEQVRTLGLPTGHPLRYDMSPDGDERRGMLLPLVPGGTYLDEPAALAAAEHLAREGGT